MLLYASTLFVGAFLLFLVQPVFAKEILPWFGGSAAVWTTCLVFFQTTLLGGYAYADALVHRLAPRAQAAVHTTLLVLSLAALPIVPAGRWQPTGAEAPLWLIFGTLAATIGLPYFLLSTTSPLVQAWFTRTRRGASPYRLFALSNTASMLALVGYPFLLEPWISTRTQAIGWSFGYVAFVGLISAAAWLSAKERPASPLTPREPTPKRGRKARRGEVSGVAASGTDAVRDAPPTGLRQGLWAMLGATASLLLLAVTNHITQNIAAVPLLWVMPLAIYLLSFILCFDGSGWYRRERYVVLLAVGLAAMAWTLADPSLMFALRVHIGVFYAGLFLACMFCHGELARLKPAPGHLTRFYLMIALGGASGSVLVGLVAPLVLPAYFEMAGGLALCAALLLWQVRRDPPIWRALAVAALIATVGCGVWSVHTFYENTTFASRNFYGALRIEDFSQGEASYRVLVNGTIRHGTQFVSPGRTREPTAYFARTSGIGRLLDVLHLHPPLRVGVVGLGAGTLAAYGAKGDVFRFYEINPDVIALAHRAFSFLDESDATIEIVPGDARLALEREPDQDFDVLVIDGFTGDAVPVHLITSEALGIYQRHVKRGGIIAYQVTNRYLDLVPVVEAQAHAHGMFMIHIADYGDGGIGSHSDWLLLSDRRESLDWPQLTSAATPVEVRLDWRLWTDDFNNLFQVLK